MSLGDYVLVTRKFVDAFKASKSGTAGEEKDEENIMRLCRDLNVRFFNAIQCRWALF